MVDFSQPPHTRPYFHITAEKWDGDHQRNALLHFINAKGLDDECLEWLYANAPEGWFREDDN